jgi:DNA-binding response OmpR family regulator
MENKPLVLVVDDDPDLVEAVSMKLESENFRVAKAFNGNQAWEQIKKERPALAVLDVMMPEKDGYQVCDEIKQDNEYKDLTVILLTAVGSEVPSSKYTHRQGRTMLADEYIPKPVDLDELVTLVKEYTQQES